LLDEDAIDAEGKRQRAVSKIDIDVFRTLKESMDFTGRNAAAIAVGIPAGFLNSI